MKRTSMMLMVLALIIGMVQCKKNNETNMTENEAEKVFITLNVNQSNGSRLKVNPPHVSFENGDKIYVASNGVYVGRLEYNGTNFSGEISGAAEGQPLYFYLLGNMTPSETLVEGITSCSVSISDQTSLTPVIACAPSNENFGSTITNFTSTLRNKCALVKFNVATSSQAATCIKGFNNKVLVSFAGNTLTPAQDGEGIITLPAGGGEKWAVLLPQEAMEPGGIGSVYSVDEEFSGTRGAVPKIFNNGYYPSGISVVINEPRHDYVDLGLPSGTLWATCNIGADVPEEYGDYFAWGETQPKDDYAWYSYRYSNGNTSKLTKYCNNSQYGYNGFTDNLTTLQPEDDAATVNWGTNWRMPTIEEWQELLNDLTITKTWTTQNGKHGWLFTASNGNGSLFLPAAGYYNQEELCYGNNWCRYGSSSLNTDNSTTAMGFNFKPNESDCSVQSYSRFYGRPVRAVRVQSQN